MAGQNVGHDHKYPQGRNGGFVGSIDDLSDDLDSYFTGPINSSKTSKLPYFMRVRGSVLPGLILPMLFLTVWSVVFVTIHQTVHKLDISPQLITVLGFLVGLSLSFRSSTAYERYNDGRKCWSALSLNCRNLARMFWIHARERPGPDGEDDLLGKLTAINLLIAFCVALKHKLRHRPEYDEPDLQGLISHLQTFAKKAYEDGDLPPRPPITTPQRISSYLGITFLEEHPTRRYKVYKKAGKLHGNLPLEIMTYLSAYVDMIIQGGNFPTPAFQSMTMTYLTNMMDALTNCERISQTPLPVAYNIVISQITWLYVLFLPFQLVGTLKWIAIPGTLIAAYIILGFAAIGREIEDPFGSDVNDLDLAYYCDTIALELDMIVSVPPPTRADFITKSENYVLYPNREGYSDWKDKGIEKIREELKRKPSRHLPPAQASAARRSMAQEREKVEDQKYRDLQERKKVDEQATKTENRDSIHAADDAV